MTRAKLSARESLAGMRHTMRRGWKRTQAGSAKSEENRCQRETGSEELKHRADATSRPAAPIQCFLSPHLEHTFAPPPASD